MGLDALPDGVAVAAAAAALGGLIGGLLSGTRRGKLVSLLIGTIVGLSAATILRMLDVTPLLDVDGYSIIWAALAGFIGAWIVTKTS